MPHDSADWGGLKATRNCAPTRPWPRRLVRIAARPGGPPNLSPCGSCAFSLYSTIVLRLRTTLRMRFGHVGPATYRPQRRAQFFAMIVRMQAVFEGRERGLDEFNRFKV